MDHPHCMAQTTQFKMPSVITVTTIIQLTLASYIYIIGFHSHFQGHFLESAHLMYQTSSQHNIREQKLKATEAGGEREPYDVHVKLVSGTS